MDNSSRPTYAPVVEDPAESYRDNHANNVAGQPLPWDKVTDLYARIEAQGLIDRWHAYENSPYQQDREMVKDWMDKLKSTVEIVYSWENPEAAKETVQELNQECLDYVKGQLRNDLNKLEPFQYDSPETKTLKLRVAHERNNVLTCGQTTPCPNSQYRNLDALHYYDPNDKGPPEIGIGSRYPQYRNLDAHSIDKGPPEPEGHLEFTANPTLSRLIQIVEDGSWGGTCAETGDEVWCGK